MDTRTRPEAGNKKALFRRVAWGRSRKEMLSLMIIAKGPSQ